ncbi:unnamed protein product [Fraxinus pennsylvanica]|uniref:DUF7138 domain-containing protein n=1 Tax=Fraxinus pennsylvanica TaxID=56036 RepID=A0AAD2A8A4_9LAMI|nr:unnamed protein product [Fraxinus pennsylvanica]
MLSQKIGISPNQISIYLVHRNKNPKSPFPDDRQRTPITGKVNFRLICRQKDCCFLVVWKRSRKSRNRRERVKEVEFSDSLAAPVLENMILLHLNQPVPFYDHITHSELANMNDRLQNLRVIRENYQMAMKNLKFNTVHGSDQEPFSDFNMGYRVSSTMMMATNETRKGFCTTYVNAQKNGSKASFHLCVNDTAIGLFRTRVGLISRPIKSPS